MGRKFKIGDKVKVLDFTGEVLHSDIFRRGQMGIVTNYVKSMPYPYYVKPLRPGWVDAFTAQELELVERK